MGCKPMKVVSSKISFRCYLQASKKSVLILRSIAFDYASCLERIVRGKHHCDVFRLKMYSGSFLILLVSPLQRAHVVA